MTQTVPSAISTAMVYVRDLRYIDELQDVFDSLKMRYAASMARMAGAGVIVQLVRRDIDMQILRVMGQAATMPRLPEDIQIELGKYLLMWVPKEALQDPAAPTMRELEERAPVLKPGLT